MIGTTPTPPRDITTSLFTVKPGVSIEDVLQPQEMERCQRKEYGSGKGQQTTDAQPAIAWRRTVGLEILAARRELHAGGRRGQ